MPQSHVVFALLPDMRSQPFVLRPPSAHGSMWATTDLDSPPRRQAPPPPPPPPPLFHEEPAPKRLRCDVAPVRIEVPPSPVAWVEVLKVLFRPWLQKKGAQRRPLKVASGCSGLGTPSLALEEPRVPCHTSHHFWGKHGGLATVGFFSMGTAKLNVNFARCRGCLGVWLASGHMSAGNT